MSDVPTWPEPVAGKPDAGRQERGDTVTGDEAVSALAGAVDLEPRSEGRVRLHGRRRLGWAEYGDPDGQPVLWFHGTPGGRRQLPPSAPLLAERLGVRLIGMDRPGTGLSTTHRYDRVVDVVDDAAAVLDHLEVARCAVAGLSGGGPYALAVSHAMADRISAAAVLGGVAPTCGPERAEGIARLLVPGGALFGALAVPAGEVVTMAARPLRRWMSPIFDVYATLGPGADRPLLRDASLKTALLADLASSLEGGLRAPLCDLVVFGRDWGFSLAEIEVPVTFWHGDADAIVPFDHGAHQADLVPNGELRCCPGGGHFAGFVRTEEVLTTLVERS
ncbi:MAG: alpha/beta hydrolase [Acidimicrobiia bacterium]|nr:alpha/beta hydrolase [Acidimicrobiia bacterium]